MSTKQDQTISIAIRKLIHSEKIKTQQQLSEALKNNGHTVNQSKVSRLLNKLNIVKVKDDEQQLIYGLPKEPHPPAIHISLSNLIIEVLANESQVVIHTSPGSASLIGRIIDYNRDSLNIIGVVAGDDTLFVVPTSTKGIDTCLNNIQKLLETL